MKMKSNRGLSLKEIILTIIIMEVCFLNLSFELKKALCKNTALLVVLFGGYVVYHVMSKSCCFCFWRDSHQQSSISANATIKG
jgi:hypothetical protein